MKTMMLSFFAIVYVMSISPSSHAASYCVGTSSELSESLTDAADSGESDIIMVRSGVFTGQFSFDPGTEAGGISILGGYNADCTSRVDDASMTILDGNGSGTPLRIRVRGNGNVRVEGLTLQHGGDRGLYVFVSNSHTENGGAIDITHCRVVNNAGGGGIYLQSSDTLAYTPGTVRLEGNIISGNASSYGGGGITISAQWDSIPGDIVLTNNVVIGNRGSHSSGGIYLSAGSQTLVLLINNTVADNIASTTAFNAAGGVYLYEWNTPTVYMVNTIVRGNTSQNGADDIWFDDNGGTYVGRHNNYSEISGSWTEAAGNRDVDPAFISPGYWDDNGTPYELDDDSWIDGDYHLSAASACIDAADGSVLELPTVDIDGDPRSVDGNHDGTAIPDIGADERVGDCIADTEPDGDVDGADLAAVANGMAPIDTDVIAAEFGRIDCAGWISDCPADTEPDGDVDGSDLALMAAGGVAIDLQVFAGEFGREDCI